MHGQDPYHGRGGCRILLIHVSVLMTELFSGVHTIVSITEVLLKRAIACCEVVVVVSGVVRVGHLDCLSRFLCLMVSALVQG